MSALLRCVARATIEFKTPFHLGAGREGELADAEVVRDANGLPAIPGSSLAGVLRAAYASHYGASEAAQLFGYQGRRAEMDRGSAEGRGSALTVSWACIHDGNGDPVEGIASPARLSHEVLLSAMTPTVRDHVRINHRGASDAARSGDGVEVGQGGHGKFDELAVCAGHRFTFELELADSGDAEQRWSRLLGVLASPDLRIGAKSRRGFGAFKLITLKRRTFDLARAEDFTSYRSLPVSLVPECSCLEEEATAADHPRETTLSLRLDAEGHWMFGGGDDEAADHGDADMAPVRDSIVRWDQTSGAGKVVRNLLVIPGSAVKGALAHRVAFHDNRMRGVFADQVDPGAFAENVGERNPSVRELFGCVKHDEDGQRGRILIDDSFIEQLPKTKPLSHFIHHVSLDRFTGGARAGLLFNERPVWGGELELRLVVARDATQVSKNARP